jgi:hypothetical protein
MEEWQILEWKRWAPLPEFHKSKETYETIISQILNNQHFSFLRMGDGDMKVYLNMEGVSVPIEYKKIFKSVMEPIFTINNPKLIIGVENNTACSDIMLTQNCAMYKDTVEQFYAMLSADALAINCVTFMHMYVETGLTDFFKSLKHRNVILVGSSFLKNIKIECASIKYVTTKPWGSWEDQAGLETQVDTLINMTVDPVILYACSISGKMLLSKMFFKYSNITQIDIGSAFDPYAGIVSRPWHKNELT